MDIHYPDETRAKASIEASAKAPRGAPARAPGGFSLIELLIALAIAAILLGTGVPSFVSMMQDASRDRLVEPTRLALMRARSEAVRSSRDVTVCPRASDTSCGTDWDNGLLVFVDNVVVPGESDATRDATDELLAVVPAHGTGHTLLVYASTDRTATGIYTPNFLRYGFDGRASWQNGSLLACDARGEAHSRGLNVALTGHILTARTAAGGDVVSDVFGREIECS